MAPDVRPLSAGASPLSCSELQWNSKVQDNFSADDFITELCRESSRIIQWSNPTSPVDIQVETPSPLETPLSPDFRPRSVESRLPSRPRSVEVRPSSVKSFGTQDVLSVGTIEEEVGMDETHDNAQNLEDWITEWTYENFEKAQESLDSRLEQVRKAAESPPHQQQHQVAESPLHHQQHQVADYCMSAEAFVDELCSESLQIAQWSNRSTPTWIDTESRTATPVQYGRTKEFDPEADADKEISDILARCVPRPDDVAAEPPDIVDIAEPLDIVQDLDREDEYSSFEDLDREEDHSSLAVQSMIEDVLLSDFS